MFHTVLLKQDERIRIWFEKVSKHKGNASEKHSRIKNS